MKFRVTWRTGDFFQQTVEAESREKAIEKAESNPGDWVTVRGEDDGIYEAEPAPRGMSEQKPKLVKVWPVPSSSNPGLSYDVEEYDNGRFVCQCMAFTRGKQQRGKTIWERECKHTLEAQNMKSGNIVDVSEHPLLKPASNILEQVASA